MIVAFFEAGQALESQDLSAAVDGQIALAMMIDDGKTSY